MCVLLLALGLLALGSDPGCDAHFLGTVERGPCQAKNPLGRGFLDGTCMPMIKCKETLRGIIRLNFPVICGFELLRPIVCCPNMGRPASGSGGGGGGGAPGDIRNPLDPFNVLDDIFKGIPGLGPAVGGPHAGARREPQVPHQPYPPFGGGSGIPVRPEDNYPPDVGPQPPHGNSPGTGPVPPRPGSGGGAPVIPSRPAVPSRPVVPPTPAGKPGKRPAPSGGSSPPGEGDDAGAPCDKPECEPGDSYIHLIDPRRGKN
ncbi:actin nucleation-promoting factor WAS-like isoform X6 [Dermacentor albipictus]|uniref:actin nucleation-promoting factor WAS-like isoform X6 n=1 Tax=Dermacentor albipictus TaxID=60249 RepID=UPI0031FD4FEC